MEVYLGVCCESLPVIVSCSHAPLPVLLLTVRHNKGGGLMLVIRQGEETLYLMHAVLLLYKVRMRSVSFNVDQTSEQWRCVFM